LTSTGLDLVLDDDLTPHILRPFGTLCIRLSQLISYVHIADPYVHHRTPQVVDRPNAQEVLRATLHAVLFHRLFGLVKPRTVDVLDVTMPGVEDANIERTVSEKVGALWRAVEDRVDKRGQVCCISVYGNLPHVYGMR
jgi:hypothetical protein